MHEILALKQNQAQCHMPMSPVLEGQKPQDEKFKAFLGYTNEFFASLGLHETPSLKEKLQGCLFAWQPAVS